MVVTLCAAHPSLGPPAATGRATRVVSCAQPTRNDARRFEGHLGLSFALCGAMLKQTVQSSVCKMFASVSDEFHDTTQQPELAGWATPSGTGGLGAFLPTCD